jgi:hypothetical protein
MVCNDGMIKALHLVCHVPIFGQQTPCPFHHFKSINQKNFVPPPTGEDRERAHDARGAARVCSLGDSTDCQEAALPKEASQAAKGMEGTDIQA